MIWFMLQLWTPPFHPTCAQHAAEFKTNGWCHPCIMLYMVRMSWLWFRQHSSALSWVPISSHLPNIKFIRRTDNRHTSNYFMHDNITLCITYGGCSSRAFDPPAATAAGWLTFSLIIYKWSISRCVPAAASGLLLILLQRVETAGLALFGYYDIYTPDIWRMFLDKESCCG